MSITDDQFFTNKTTALEHWAREDQKNNVVYDGIVNSVSALNRLSATCIVYIPQLLSFVKCEATSGYNSNFIGKTVDYRVNDRVRVSFIRGKTERPVIVGSLPTLANEQTLSTGTIPAPGTGIAGAPNAVIPGAAQHAFNVQGEVFPLYV